MTLHTLGADARPVDELITEQAMDERTRRCPWCDRVLTGTGRCRRRACQWEELGECESDYPRRGGY